MTTSPLTRSQQLLTGLAASWLAVLLTGGLLAGSLPLRYGPGVPDLSSLGVAPGTGGHLLGTDPLGRDVLTSVVYGARALLLIDGPGTLLAVVGGGLLGGAAGYWGDQGLRLRWPLLLVVLALLWVVVRPPWPLGLGGAALALLWAGRRGGSLQVQLDTWLVEVATLLGAIPWLVLLLLLFAGADLGAGGVALVLAALTWPEAARIVRAAMLHVREQPYVEAARALGLSEGRVWWRHAMPAACYPLASYAPLLLATLVSVSNTLDFLGMSQGGPAARWGVMLGQYAQDTSAWWLIAFPGGALLLTILALQQLAWLGTRRQRRQ